MSKRASIDFNKQDDRPKQDDHPKQDEKLISLSLEEWHDEIRVICTFLAVKSEDFMLEKTYKAIDSYSKKYDRWLYSVVSNFLFSINDKDQTRFLTNLDNLQEYAHLKIQECDPGDKANLGHRKKTKNEIIKLWDHASLAVTQDNLWHENERRFSERFSVYIEPYETQIKSEMNMQFISLIAIFTALSFIAFGGISYLDNILDGAQNIPIVQLIIVGCIWSLCICNLVFTFIYFVARLTKLPLESTHRKDATITQKYPFFVWTNFVLCLILCLCSWLYFVDYANIGSWFLILSANNSVLISLAGAGIMVIVFIFIACLLCGKVKLPKRWMKKAK